MTCMSAGPCSGPTGSSELQKQERRLAALVLKTKPHFAVYWGTTEEMLAYKEGEDGGRV